MADARITPPRASRSRTRKIPTGKLASTKGLAVETVADAPKTATTSDAALIKVIRRQVVAEVKDDPSSKVPPLQAAFVAASDYIAENANDDPVSVEFEYLGGTFRATYEPTRNQSDEYNLNLVSDERLIQVARDRGMDVYMP